MVLSTFISLPSTSRVQTEVINLGHVHGQEHRVEREAEDVHVAVAQLTSRLVYHLAQVEP
jgi:hypothetical protein